MPVPMSWKTTLLSLISLAKWGVLCADTVVPLQVGPDTGLPLRSFMVDTLCSCPLPRDALLPDSQLSEPLELPPLLTLTQSHVLSEADQSDSLSIQWSTESMLAAARMLLKEAKALGRG